MPDRLRAARLTLEELGSQGQVTREGMDLELARCGGLVPVLCYPLLVPLTAAAGTILEQHPRVVLGLFLFCLALSLIRQVATVPAAKAASGASHSSGSSAAPSRLARC